MITLNSTDFTTYLNRAVCVFSICLTGCFIMIMNRLYCEGRMLKCVAEAITGFIPLPTVEATPLGHEDNRNCKRSAFICVHKQ